MDCHTAADNDPQMDATSEKRGHDGLPAQQRSGAAAFLIVL